MYVPGRRSRKRARLLRLEGDLRPGDGSAVGIRDLEDEAPGLLLRPHGSADQDEERGRRDDAGGGVKRRIESHDGLLVA
jgi:hypothetical protein